MAATSRAGCIQREAEVEADPRWARVLARDRAADGQFWYSVATTGVYCRPSCPSRSANPRNVGLHGSLTEAKATGFRPCKRCNPDCPSADFENAAIVARACRRIEESESVPSLNRLAQASDLSTSHFHRLFKTATGLTPKGYAEAHRASRLRDSLATGHTVTEAMYAAGFSSSGRFYEKSKSILGMTPTRYRAGGANERIRYAVAQTSLGIILVASSEKGVASILIGDDPNELARDLQDRFPKAHLIVDDKAYRSMII
jgi:AraC family transcriptional regulator, regulatory protein of adaptative response / methylated-DNA-[protein]-cysteine methyltransferase